MTRQALGQQRRPPRQRHRHLRPGVLGREADRPDRQPRQRAERDGAPDEPAHADELDQHRRDEEQRHRGLGDLQRAANDEGQGERERQVEADGHQRAAAAGQKARHDERLRPTEGQQQRVPHLAELRDPPVELVQGRGPEVEEDAREQQGQRSPQRAAATERLAPGGPRALDEQQHAADAGEELARLALDDPDFSPERLLAGTWGLLERLP